MLLQPGNLFQHFMVSERSRFQMMLLGALNEHRQQLLVASVGLDGRADAYPAHFTHNSRG
jgi:ABC-type transporter Mla maintaining outer membrane lipid asymmetry ATPase subunit MlaF